MCKNNKNEKTNIQEMLEKIIGNSDHKVFIMDSEGLQKFLSEKFSNITADEECEEEDCKNVEQNEKICGCEKCDCECEANNEDEADDDEFFDVLAHHMIAMDKKINHIGYMLDHIVEQLEKLDIIIDDVDLIEDDIDEISNKITEIRMTPAVPNVVINIYGRDDKRKTKTDESTKTVHNHHINHNVNDEDDED